MRKQFYLQTTVPVESAAKEWIERWSKKNPYLSMDYNDYDQLLQLGKYIELRSGVASCLATLEEITHSYIFLKLHIHKWNKEQITINEIII